nr:immunoglobulin light chain junction region [Macaca mulatta]MOV78907.1 immunoglobulin light chain junction region [Macaca mulatta]MOV79053.1 immunoglobulin light chain junction region [Macaca mulatta]MOV79204.1 immunoglobulin light chain junction region [Macaca mulatta]MOV82802.1 immunoglobulin light chain junction region [Macaca mulatta]
CLQYKSYPLTF